MALLALAPGPPRSPQVPCHDWEPDPPVLCSDPTVPSAGLAATELNRTVTLRNLNLNPGGARPGRAQIGPGV